MKYYGPAGWFKDDKGVLHEVDPVHGTQVSISKERAEGMAAKGHRFEGIDEPPVVRDAGIYPHDASGALITDARRIRRAKDKPEPEIALGDPVPTPERATPADIARK